MANCVLVVLPSIGKIFLQFAVHVVWTLNLLFPLKFSSRSATSPYMYSFNTQGHKSLPEDQAEYIEGFLGTNYFLLHSNQRILATYM